MSNIIFKFTKEEANSIGLFRCICGHRENNHFEHPPHICSRLECGKTCTGFKAKASIGEDIKQDIKNLLALSLHQLERDNLLTGPYLVCKLCSESVRRTEKSTFEDIEHEKECLIRELKEYIIFLA